MTIGEVNPARAGMIPDLDELLIEGVGKPRASGDDPNPGTLLFWGGS